METSATEPAADNEREDGEVTPENKLTLGLWLSKMDFDLLYNMGPPVPTWALKWKQTLEE